MTPQCPKLLLGDEYIGESWLPVVDFLVYFEQASEQVYKKISGDERPSIQDSPMY